jgi:hypothetical protein
MAKLVRIYFYNTKFPSLSTKAVLFAPSSETDKLWCFSTVSFILPYTELQSEHVFIRFITNANIVRKYFILNIYK